MLDPLGHGLLDGVESPMPLPIVDARLRRSRCLQRGGVADIVAGDRLRIDYILMQSEADLDGRRICLGFRIEPDDCARRDKTQTAAVDVIDRLRSPSFALRLSPPERRGRRHLKSLFCSQG